MADRDLKLERAMRTLPQSRVLSGLREALYEISRSQGASAWEVAEEFSTLARREADLDELEARIPGLAERARERMQRVLQHSVASLRAVQEGDLAGAARAMIRGGEVLEAAGELEEAEHFYDQAVALGRKPRDRRPEGLAHCRRARVARARGGSLEAIAAYRDGWEIAEACGDREVMVLACTGLGNVHVDRGEWEAARSWYGRGLRVLAEGEPDRRAEWELYSNLAIVARRSGSLAASEDWLRRASETIAELDDPQGAVYVHHGTGQLHLARGDAEEAEAAFRKALETAGDGGSRAVILNSLAEALLLGGRTDEAEEVTRAAEEAALSAGVIRVLPEVYRNLGRVATARGRREGFVFFEQALSLLSAEEAPSEWAATQHRYALFDTRMGDRQAAEARLEEAIALFDRTGATREAEVARRDLDVIRTTSAAAERPTTENQS